MKKLVIIGIVATAIFIIADSCKHEPQQLLDPNAVVNTPGNGQSNPTGGEQSCSSDTVYFQNTVLPLLISSCAKSNCHDAASHQDGVQLTSYEMIMNTADVDPGQPNESKLYRVLNETDPDKIMPRPPSPPLTAAEKAIIYKWILQGAQNNSCNDCDTTTITYSGAIVPLINGNCKGCHNASFTSGGLNLVDYNTVRAIAMDGRFLGAIEHQPGYAPMPRGAAKLNDCKITQVRKWIAAGAQNN